MSATGRGRLRERLDRYYTPDLLAAALVRRLPIQAGDRVFEPHVGGGAFARALLPTGCQLVVNDVDPGAPGLALGHLARVGDALSYQGPAFDWVIGNPPYREAQAHVIKARQLGRHVCYLLRLGFLESRARFQFWQANPLRRLMVLSERPSFTGGGVDSAAYGLFWWDREWPAEPTLDVISWRPRRRE